MNNLPVVSIYTYRALGAVFHRPAAHLDMAENAKRQFRERSLSETAEQLRSVFGRGPLSFTELKALMVMGRYSR